MSFLNATFARTRKMFNDQTVIVRRTFAERLFIAVIVPSGFGRAFPPTTRNTTASSAL
jgi:hypothetical protein